MQNQNKIDTRKYKNIKNNVGDLLTPWKKNMVIIIYNNYKNILDIYCFFCPSFF
jgi:hypothetical protein